jgi:hypothetical protein
MLNKRGIVLIAVTHPIYGCLAYNLVITVRAIDKETPITLVADHKAISYLNEQQRSVFDQIIYTDLKGFGAKLHLDLLTPYEETIFLDADMAWMPKHPPATLFHNIGDTDYTGITEGRMNLETMNAEEVNSAYYFWAKPEEIKEVYKLETGYLYQWRSEMIYFRKTPRVKKMFNRARKIHAQPRLKTVQLFGAQVPDELALNIACALYDIHPHQFKWTPAYWPKLHGERVPEFEEMYNQYYLLSAGSHYATGSLKAVYHRLVKAAAHKLGQVQTFPLQNKSELIPDRRQF